MNKLHNESNNGYLSRRNIQTCMRRNQEELANDLILYSCIFVFWRIQKQGQLSLQITIIQKQNQFILLKDKNMLSLIVTQRNFRDLLSYVSQSNKICSKKLIIMNIDFSSQLIVLTKYNIFMGISYIFLQIRANQGKRMFYVQNQLIIKMKSKDEVVKKVSGYHLVIRIEDKRISFFAYKNTHHLYQSYSQDQIVKNISWFENVEELYQYLKQQPSSILRLEQNNLYFTINIGKRKREIKILLYQSQMSNEKAVKIKLKNASFEFKKVSSQIEILQKKVQSIQEKNQQILDEKSKLIKVNRKIQRFIKESQQRSIYLASEEKRYQQSLIELEEAYKNMQKMLASYTKNKKAS